MEKLSITASELESLLPAVIFGAEGEGDGDDSQNSDGTGDNDEGGDDHDDSGDKGDNSDDDKGHEDNSGLKSALQKERARANKAEKALKAANKAKEEAALAEKSEIEQAKIREEKASQRAEKLANGLLTTKLDHTIERIAKDMGFIDVNDVVNAVERKDFVYEQDEDDPSDITIDEKSIETAVKALAAKKAHWIRSDDDDSGSQKTGGQFGRGGSKKKPTPEATYRERYPSL